MRKILAFVLFVTALGFLAASPASARPDNNGEFQKKITECFGGIGDSLDRAGQGFAKAFWGRADVD